MKVLVAYDGTLQSKDALRYGLEKAREKGGQLLALHVFNSSMFVDYEVSPKAFEAARKEAAAQVEDARHLIKEEGAGVRTALFVGEGNPEEEVIRFAEERNVDVLLCPPGYRSVVRKFRKMIEERGKATSENALFDNAEKLRMAVVFVQ